MMNKQEKQIRCLDNICGPFTFYCYCFYIVKKIHTIWSNPWFKYIESFIIIAFKITQRKLTEGHYFFFIQIIGSSCIGQYSLEQHNW